jgi:hypothetical protein
MTTTQQIIDAKYLSVCPPSEAVEWLRQRRIENAEREHACYEEEALERRNDPYIDFGLARYGTCTTVAKRVYSRGDLAIRCTFLAHFPAGGFDPYGGDTFELADELPKQVDDLNALVSNVSLTDDLLQRCFERQGVFSSLNDDEHQSVLWVIKDNPRLITSPDNGLDGYKRYSHDSLANAAWALAEKVPNTPTWARVLFELLRKCPLPFEFDPIPVFERWHFSPEMDEAGNYSNLFSFPGILLRSRLADVLETDDALLTASDPAMRVSFYERYSPSEYPNWLEFAKTDKEFFLHGALHNKHLWRKAECRYALAVLCEEYPDQEPDIFRMREHFRFIKDRVLSEHPEWFKDEFEDP